MTYMRTWKSLRLTSHTWFGLNPQIGRLSRIVVSLVYFIFSIIIKSMIAEELTEYLIALQIDVQVRQELERLWSSLM
jgi:hypothetical protein